MTSTRLDLARAALRSSILSHDTAKVRQVYEQGIDALMVLLRTPWHLIGPNDAIDFTHPNVTAWLLDDNSDVPREERWQRTVKTVQTLVRCMGNDAVFAERTTHQGVWRIPGLWDLVVDNQRCWHVMVGHGAYRCMANVLAEHARSPIEGFNLDARNLFGETALMVAVQRGDDEALTLLLNGGANPLLSVEAGTGPGTDAHHGMTVFSILDEKQSLSDLSATSERRYARCQMILENHRLRGVVTVMLDDGGGAGGATSEAGRVRL